MGLFRLDAGLADDLAPLVDIGADAAGERLGRSRLCFQPLLGHGFFDVRCAQRRVDLAVSRVTIADGVPAGATIATHNEAS